jgi:hypothetical protein
MVVLPILVVCGLFAAVLLSIEAGHRIGIRRRSRMPQGFKPVYPTVESSVFALMGLLIAFTFYGAGSRFDARRNLIVREANAIGTTYLRLDLLPPETQPELREVFRAYVRSRLDIYRKIADIEALNAALDQSLVLQRSVWRKTVDATKGSGPAEKSLVLTTLNQMIDITTEQTVTAKWTMTTRTFQEGSGIPWKQGRGGLLGFRLLLVHHRYVFPDLRRHDHLALYATTDHLPCDRS